MMRHDAPVRSSSASTRFVNKGVQLLLLGAMAGVALFVALSGTTRTLASLSALPESPPPRDGDAHPLPTATTLYGVFPDQVRSRTCRRDACKGGSL